MTELRLNEALRRLRDRAAAAALSEEAKSVEHSSLRAFLRQAIAEETRDLGLVTSNEMRARLDEVERKVDELIQFLGTLENETLASSDAIAEPQFPITETAPQAREMHRAPSRGGRGSVLIVTLVIAALLAAVGLILTVTGYMPSVITGLLDQLAFRFDTFLAGAFPPLSASNLS